MKPKKSKEKSYIEHELRVNLGIDATAALRALVTTHDEVGYAVQSEGDEQRQHLGNALTEIWTTHRALLSLAGLVKLPLRECEFISHEEFLKSLLPGDSEFAKNY
jgi:hypothetical protein